MKLNNFLLISTTVLALGVLGGTSANTFADETDENNAISSQQKSSPNISQSLADTANTYISFNEQRREFIVQDNLAKVVSPEEFNAVKAQLAATNAQINQATLTNPNTQVIAPDNTEYSIKGQNNMGVILKAGKTAIKFHWNYARIYLSKATLRTAVSVGVVVGGVYAPSRVVQVACGIAGLNVNKITSGIWFDYNYFTKVLPVNAGLQ